MGSLIQPGQLLVAGTAPGQLNQYYAFSDANSTTVTAASLANLSSQYTIPAGEADYSGVAYEMSCGGYGQQGSTAQTLKIGVVIGSSVGSPAIIPTSALVTGDVFAWSAKLELVCSDGASSWWYTCTVCVDSSANTSFSAVGANSSAWSKSISSAIPVAIQAEWGATTGAPTITNARTVWKKVS